MTARLAAIVAITAGALIANEASLKLFTERVQPIFAQHCQSCHNKKSPQGGFDIATTEGLRKGGVKGPAIVAGQARNSLLYRLLVHEETPAMPYKGEKLPTEAIRAVADWINSGAELPESGDAKQGQKLFREQVRAILETHCFACHGGQFKQAGFSMATRAGLLKGSDAGPIIVSGNSGASKLMQALRHERSPGMPFQAAKLPPENIAVIARWIDLGAPYDAPLDPSRIVVRRSDHWAFQPVRRPALPREEKAAPTDNAIDLFLLAEIKKRDLKPLPEADRYTLLRRVTLDLTGIAPTQTEILDFVHDQAPGAYERVVDRLLASPRYGERWGRHWMDIWRYSDWYGAADVRNSQPFIWHWRDWIIESLNSDRGYDRMVQEMVAGDEIAPTDPKTLRATGYLARNWYRFNRNVWLQDTVESTTAAFLGVTMKCARCHDHKYDPIAHEEYYKFRAFFEPHDVRRDRLEGQPDLRKDGLPRVYDSIAKEAAKDPDSIDLLPPIYGETYRFIGGNETTPDKDHPLSPGVPLGLGAGNVQIRPVELPLDSFYPDLRATVRADLIRQAREEIDHAEKRLKEAQTSVESERARAAAPIRTIDPPIDFQSKIAPIFERSCSRCHGADKRSSGLDLSSVETILEGGNKRGPAVVIPGKSAESALLQYLGPEGRPRMPLGGPPLPDDQIALLAQWIDRIPEDESQKAVRSAEARQVEEKNLAWAKANAPAVEARIAAEVARYATPPDPALESLSTAARKAEYEANLLAAERDLLVAQQRLAEALRPITKQSEKGRQRKIAAAQKQLAAAQEALTKTGADYTPIGSVYPKTSTGRRLALAQWMTSTANPLTARVAVNHIWLRHFGKAIVPTVSNFGRNGKPPTHPELLDWLAAEFMENGWSMKHLHRLMVTSSAYRRQSSALEATHSNAAIDSENRYYWRMNPRRMEAEVVRDTILALGGQLDSTVGGPEVDEKIAVKSRRRSLYIEHTPATQLKVLSLFDGADANVCFERTTSITPQQALVLANSALSLEHARLIADQVQKNSPTKFIENSFETVLGRPPSAEERSRSEKFLLTQAALFEKDAETQARASLVHVLLNHNDFVTIR